MRPRWLSTVRRETKSFVATLGVGQARNDKSGDVRLAGGETNPDRDCLECLHQRSPCAVARGKPRGRSAVVSARVLRIACCGCRHRREFCRPEWTVAVTARSCECLERFFVVAIAAQPFDEIHHEAVQAR